MMKSRPRERVLICGLGHVGYRVARLLLRLGVPVALIGENLRRDWARALAAAGAQIVEGSPRDDAVLAEARIGEASALIGAAEVDLANLELSLDARRMRPDLRLVLRIFDRDLARSLEQSLGNTRALGASALAAPVMAFAGLRRPIKTVLGLDEHQVLVLSVELSADSPLVGLSAAAVRERFGLVVLGASDKRFAVGRHVTVAGEREAQIAAGLIDPSPEHKQAQSPTLVASLRTTWFNAPRPLRTLFLVLIALSALSVLIFRFAFDPPIDLIEAIYYTVTTVTTTGYGDITPRTSGAWMMIYSSLFMVLGSVTMAVLYSFATSYVVSEQLRTELGRPPLPREGHVIVVGIGNVGYRTWDDLTRSGYDVVAIDNDPNGEFFAALRARSPCASGDARLGSTLMAAGLDRARAVIATTGDDAVNLGIALTARRIAPNVRTVVRVFDADFAQKLETSGLVDVAISTSRVAAPTFAAAAMFADVAGAFVDADGLTALRWHEMPPAWAGRSPRELDVEVLFVERERRLTAWDPELGLPDSGRVLSIERRPLT